MKKNMEKKVKLVCLIGIILLFVVLVIYILQIEKNVNKGEIVKKGEIVIEHYSKKKKKKLKKENKDLKSQCVISQEQVQGESIDYFTDKLLFISLEINRFYTEFTILEIYKTEVENFAESLDAIEWMPKHLDVSKYRDGSGIKYISNMNDWANATEGAWCYYGNDGSKYNSVHGKLYNWYAVNNMRGLAPEGYYIPNINQLKELLPTYPYKNLFSGERKQTGGFSQMGERTFLWSSDGSALYYSSKKKKGKDSTGVVSGIYRLGASVRCIKEKDKEYVLAELKKLLKLRVTCNSNLDTLFNEYSDPLDAEERVTFTDSMISAIKRTGNITQEDTKNLNTLRVKYREYEKIYNSAFTTCEYIHFTINDCVIKLKSILEAYNTKVDEDTSYQEKLDQLSCNCQKAVASANSSASDSGYSYTGGPN